jgi:hypothetical protein
MPVTKPLAKRHFINGIVIKPVHEDDIPLLGICGIPHAQIVWFHLISNKSIHN